MLVAGRARVVEEEAACASATHNTRLVAAKACRPCAACPSRTFATFAAKVDYATGMYPQGVAVGDFNADGKPDLALANVNGKTVSVLLTNG